VIVVTGGAGFIGKVLIERLKLKTKEKILCVDFRPHPYVKNMHPQAFLQKMMDLDFAKSISIVFHNGACSDTTNTDIHYVMANNFDYSTVLLRRCMDSGTRIIYASSASVYGFSQHSHQNEADDLQPRNIYAKSKALFDDYACMFMDYHSQIVGLRYFNVYGRHESHKGNMASVMYKFFQQKEGGRIHLFEKSEFYKRDFIHVDDIVDINFFFWKNPELSGVFNAGTGHPRSFHEIGQIFSKRYDTEINYIPMPKKLEQQYQEYTCADTVLLTSKYNKNFLSLEDGVSRYLRHLEAA
jgi:ADP-L-glycero-D-manno-heptose 6-epimerase